MVRGMFYIICMLSISKQSRKHPIVITWCYCGFANAYTITKKMIIIIITLMITTILFSYWLLTLQGVEEGRIDFEYCLLWVHYIHPKSDCEKISTN